MKNSATKPEPRRAILTIRMLESSVGLSVGGSLENRITLSYAGFWSVMT
jgi:hypothetical protein